MCPVNVGTWIRGNAAWPSLNESTGGRREDWLLSGSESTVGALESVSSSESSSEDGVGGRRAGGSFSPRAMVRVGGGGRRPEPRALRSVGVPLEGRELDGSGCAGIDSG
jgi:hypothetical protein